MTPDDVAKLIALPWYPGQTEPEAQIVREWLASRGVGYDSIDFNVRLGDGQAPDPSHLPGVQRQTVLVTQKRADILARAAGRTTIIEAKVRAGLNVLGQLLGYRDLFLERFPDEDEPGLAVICRRIDDDTARVLTGRGITVLLYED